MLANKEKKEKKKKQTTKTQYNMKRKRNIMQRQQFN